MTFAAAQLWTGGALGRAGLETSAKRRYY